MTAKRKPLIWPLLLLTLLLFVLTLFVPRQWQPLARRTVSELEQQQLERLAGRQRAAEVVIGDSTIGDSPIGKSRSGDSATYLREVVAWPPRSESMPGAVASDGDRIYPRPTSIALANPLTSGLSAPHRLPPHSINLPAVVMPGAVAMSRNWLAEEAEFTESTGWAKWSGRAESSEWTKWSGRAGEDQVVAGDSTRVVELLAAADLQARVDRIDLGHRPVAAPLFGERPHLAAGRMSASDAGRSSHVELASGPSTGGEPETARRLPALDSLAPPAAPDEPRADRPEGSAGANSVVRRSPALKPRQPWPKSESLAGRLANLNETAELRQWAGEVSTVLARLNATKALDAPACGEAFERLRQLAAKGYELGLQADELAIRAKQLRAAYALSQRVEIWSRVHQISAERDVTLVPVSLSTPAQTQQAIATLKARLQRMRYGTEWAEYLFVPALIEQMEREPATDTAAIRNLARRALLRYEFADQSPTHRPICRQPEFVDLANGLRVWAAEPIDYSHLLAALERYEAEPSPNNARQLATARQTLSWSNHRRVVELGQRIDMHYRNANVRVAVSNDLINRLLSDPQTVEEDVYDYIGGARTWGRSATELKLGLQLRPARNHWNMMLMAQGDIASETLSSRGPARFLNEGAASFYAEKAINVHREGVRAESTRASASLRANALLALETEYDGWPLVGELAHAIALNQYSSQAEAARWEVEYRIANRVRSRLDEQVAEQVREAEQYFDRHVYSPFRTLALNPCALEMRTTDQRIIGRYRLAGFKQLAAHTPRPVAPADCLISVQVHQSALNNIVEQLGWPGHRGNLRDFLETSREIFGNPDFKLGDDFPDDVIVQFADDQAVRFAFEEGRATLTLAFAELSRGRSTWRDFTVRVHYRPATEDEVGDLVRDQYVELIGQRLRFSDQIALRGIFSRVFNLEHPFDLISRQLAHNPKLANLMVSQAVIDEGWLGWALSDRPADRQAANSTNAATR